MISDFFKLNVSRIIILMFVLVGCTKNHLDLKHLGVEDRITLQYAKNKLTRVRGADIEMYFTKPDSNTTIVYTFFSDKLYSKKWICSIDSSSYFESFSRGIYCRTNDCIGRFNEGETVFVENSENNQYYKCELSKVGHKLILTYHYLFKFRN